MVAALVSSTAHAATPAVSEPRGGRVGWARLISASSSWRVHDANDPLLAEFIRKQTSLKLSELPIRVHRQPVHNGMYGVFDGGRMVALLSLANFQCGWPQSRDRGASSMQMVANIYVYAMTHGTVSAAKR